MTTEPKTEQTPAFRVFMDHLHSCLTCSKVSPPPMLGLVTECDTNVELFKAMMNERGGNTEAPKE